MPELSNICTGAKITKVAVEIPNGTREPGNQSSKSKQILNAMKELLTLPNTKLRARLDKDSDIPLDEI
eukprot:15358803-Ditylum_brightwellii.AAC.1